MPLISVIVTICNSRDGYFSFEYPLVFITFNFNLFLTIHMLKRFYTHKSSEAGFTTRFISDNGKSNSSSKNSCLSILFIYPFCHGIYMRIVGFCHTRYHVITFQRVLMHTPSSIVYHGYFRTRHLNNTVSFSVL